VTFFVPDICEEGLLNRQLRPVRSDRAPSSSCRWRREQRSRGNCKKKNLLPFFFFFFLRDAGLFADFKALNHLD
jgi:hypothetical protein